MVFSVSRKCTGRNMRFETKADTVTWVHNGVKLSRIGYVTKLETAFQFLHSGLSDLCTRHSNLGTPKHGLYIFLNISVCLLYCLNQKQPNASQPSTLSTWAGVLSPSKFPGSKVAWRPEAVWCPAPPPGSALYCILSFWFGKVLACLYIPRLLLTSCTARTSFL